MFLFFSLRFFVVAFIHSISIVVPIISCTVHFYLSTSPEHCSLYKEGTTRLHCNYSVQYILLFNFNIYPNCVHCISWVHSFLWKLAAVRVDDSKLQILPLLKMGGALNALKRKYYSENEPSHTHTHTHIPINLIVSTLMIAYARSQAHINDKTYNYKFNETHEMYI